MPGPKEAAYDELISPLIAQVIALCKEHKINAAATFLLDHDEDGEPMCCTTVLPVDKTDEPGIERIEACRRVMRPQPQFAAFTIRTGPVTP